MVFTVKPQPSTVSEIIMRNLLWPDMMLTASLGQIRSRDVLLFFQCVHVRASLSVHGKSYSGSVPAQNTQDLLPPFFFFFTRVVDFTYKVPAYLKEGTAARQAEKKAEKERSVV